MQVMSVAVCLVANTISYPEGGGHLWVYLNWALGLRSCGCDVIWLEVLDDRIAPERVEASVQSLKSRLAPYGLVQALAICTRNCDAPQEAARGCLGFDAAIEMGPGAAPIIYCSQFSASTELDNRLAGYDLWVRLVGTAADPLTANPATGVFNNWSFWQYDDAGSSGPFA